MAAAVPARLKFSLVAAFLTLLPKDRLPPRTPRVRAPSLGPKLRKRRGIVFSKAPKSAPICCRCRVVIEGRGRRLLLFMGFLIVAGSGVRDSKERGLLLQIRYHVEERNGVILFLAVVVDDVCVGPLVVSAFILLTHHVQNDAMHQGTVSFIVYTFRFKKKIS